VVVFDQYQRTVSTNASKPSHSPQVNAGVGEARDAVGVDATARRKKRQSAVVTVLQNVQPVKLACDNHPDNKAQWLARSSQGR
jgi:hypothetical protein